MEGVSILDLTEHHFRILEQEGLPVADDEHAEAALEFLLQTMAALDVATRGFLDGTRRYEQQRSRADDLAGRDAFRTALVESLQDGFFVVDAEGTLVEVNSAFGALTGYGPDGVPIRSPPLVGSRGTPLSRSRDRCRALRHAHPASGRATAVAGRLHQFPGETRER